MIRRFSACSAIALALALPWGYPAKAWAAAPDVAAIDSYSNATTAVTVGGFVDPNGDPPITAIGVGIAGGPGTVTSSPAGINCTSNGLSITAGSICAAAFPVGAQVILVASPDLGLGIGFVGWSGGGCAGSGTCTITVPAGSNPSVTATFTQGTPPDCALKPRSKVAIAGPEAGHVVLHLKCDQDVAFTVDGFVTVRWKNRSGKKTGHTWPLAERSGNAQVETTGTVAMRLPRAALRRLREKHLSAFVAFELDGSNANGATAATARLKLK